VFPVSENQGSVTHWIQGAKLGGNTATRHLMERDLSRLKDLARNKLRAIGHRRGADVIRQTWLREDQA
jgi:hypothetical protein